MRAACFATSPMKPTPRVIGRLGTEALELDQSLQRDAAKTCSLGALKKLDIRRPRRSASRHERPWRSAWASPAAT